MTDPSAGILAIGNEILAGDVLNTNTQWLAQRLRARGIALTHVAIVRDEDADIANELEHALRYGPGLVLTTGGLGPTEDDRTAGAIATALHRALVLDPTALAQVETFYRRLAERGLVLDGDLNEARRKMARLPEGAVPLPNRVGAAPGIHLALPSFDLVLLPGVPQEMEAIFDGSLPALLDRRFGPGGYAEFERFARIADESVLAPLLRGVAGRHPDVYVKSRAEAFGRSPWFHLTLAARGPSTEEAARRASAAEKDLASSLRAAGIEVTETRPRPV